MASLKNNYLLVLMHDEAQLLEKYEIECASSWTNNTWGLYYIPDAAWDLWKMWAGETLKTARGTGTEKGFGGLTFLEFLQRAL